MMGWRCIRAADGVRAQGREWEGRRARRLESGDGDSEHDVTCLLAVSMSGGNI